MMPCMCVCVCVCVCMCLYVAVPLLRLGTVLHGLRGFNTSKHFSAPCCV